MRVRVRLRAGAVALAAVVGLFANACGKKGPPLPPLVRVAEPPAIAVRRLGADVHITVGIPARNVDGSTPPDLTSIEVLALTAARAPTRTELLERGVRVASVPIRTAAVAPVLATDAAPPPARAPGEELTIRDTLTGDALVPVTLPAVSPTVAPPATPAKPGATTAPAGPPEPRRYYLALAYGARRRAAAPGTMASVSIAVPPAPPRELRATYTEAALSLSWTPAEAGSAYNVYRDETREPAASPAAAPPAAAPAPTPAPLPAPPPPAPLTAMPLAEPQFSLPVEFGREVCFRVRAVRADVSGERVEGEPSAPVCVTPRDTFAPAAPVEVFALSGDGGITIMWLPNTEPDLAGYLILRGTTGDDTLLPITPSPQTATRFVDTAVTPGVRYVYAVVAVDAASNRSAPSARDEAAAR